ncbi:hypothetical protein BT96DRAFT_888515 [Gymnopus androsaceus JB14]|uniref:Uncharacterized protein n=1 Tax=Gymnopus androsaceus JB14 TaxID=1447944 RepID=A0A6A4H0Z3_9AGAR|nr:hypothetical protein BT96DRAFT_888515 [Gymnopus androsaceus JB14]
MHNRYTALSSGDDLIPHKEDINTRPPMSLAMVIRYVLPTSLLISVAFNLAALSGFWSLKSTSFPTELSLYSPANEAVSYKIVKFHRGYGNDTPTYEMAPSPEVDAAWANLTSTAKIASSISREQAKMMPNRTYPILGHDGQYMIVLHMYHLLHCLVSLPFITWLHPLDYPTFAEDSNVTMSHARHCIGSLRQSIMCTADTTPVVFQWSDRAGGALSRTDVNHVCRDFDRIVEWGERHRFDGIENIDMTVFIPDDLDN